jgi:hypothetical protein
MLGGGRQPATMVSTAQTLTQEFRPSNRRGAAPVYDGHVLVAKHGNPAIEIGKNVW